MSEDLNAWDRQPGESELWYNRFVKYYLPVRDLTQAYYAYYEERHGEPPKRPGYTMGWKKAHDKYDWERRCREYQRSVAQETYNIAIQDRAEVIDRVKQIADALENLALDKLLVDGFADANAALRGLKTAVELKMMLMDQPEYLQRITKMSDEELEREIAKLLRSWDQVQEADDEDADEEREREITGGAA